MTNLLCCAGGVDFDFSFHFDRSDVKGIDLAQVGTYTDFLLNDINTVMSEKRDRLFLLLFLSGILNWLFMLFDLVSLILIGIGYTLSRSPLDPRERVRKAPGGL